jgi:hypothetical protein
MACWADRGGGGRSGGMGRVGLNSAVTRKTPDAGGLGKKKKRRDFGPADLWAAKELRAENRNE